MRLLSCRLLARLALFLAWLPLSHSLGADLPRTLLLVDDDDVLYRPGSIKRIVPFQKAQPHPVIAPEKAWEGMLGWCSVFRDPTTGRYQLWYQAYQERRTEDKRLKCVVCYAESSDGLHWTKPELDLFPFYEEKRTNIVLIGAAGAYGDRYGCSVVVDPRDPDASRRYKMAYYDWSPGPGADGGSGTHVAFSPDGIHWTKHPDGPVAKTPFGGKGAEPPFADESPYIEESRTNGTLIRSWRIPIGMSDALDVFWDAPRGVFAAYGKTWTPWPGGGLAYKHGMARMESADFIHWSKPEVLLTVNDRDPSHLEFHTSPVFPLHGLYLSLNQILDRQAGTIDAELMSSRDGLRWQRELARHWVIPRGAPGHFDAGSILTNGTPIVLENEIRFYYGAYRGTAVGGKGLNRQVPGSSDHHSGIGLAVTPRDRFVAVEVNPEAPVWNQKKDRPKIPNTLAHVTFRPLDLTNVSRITLNADATIGSVRLEVLNEDGYRLRGYTREDARPLLGQDALAFEATWKDQSLRDLPPGRYQLRVHLEKARLFAVTLLGSP